MNNSVKQHILLTGASKKFDTVVLFKNDLTYMSPEFIEILDQDYTTDQGSPFLNVLRRIPGHDSTVRLLCSLFSLTRHGPHLYGEWWRCDASQ
jgi:hypothetical protein